MDAFFARNRLSAYLDGELTAAEARDVEAALARDPELREELDAIRGAIEMLRDGGIVEPPPGFADRLSARLEHEAMPVGWRRWARQIRPEGAMLAAAALLVVIYVGNHDSLPDLELPEEGVVAARTFDKGNGADATAAADAAGSGAPGGADEEVAPVEASAATPREYGNDAPAAPSASADGVLGNEAAKAAPPPAARTESMVKKSMPSPVTRGKVQSAAEVEPWKAAWEQEISQDNTAPQAKSDSSTTVQWSSPPPFRYRVTASSEMAMKQLAAIAAELGGTLQDSRGRPLAAYQLDAGEARSIRVSVPAHNASRLAERLREIGAVETIKEPGNLLADPNTAVGVQIELRN